MRIVCSNNMAIMRKHIYDAAATFLLSYHGVLCHQARDLFSAGSVANPDNDDHGGSYIERALKLLQPLILKAAGEIPDALFEEYWGERVKPKDRIKRWLEKIDAVAIGWIPSKVLFKQRSKR